MPCRIHAALGALICLVATDGRSHRASLTEEDQRVALLQEQGRYREAEAVLSAALKEAEQLSPSDPAIGNTMNNLALVYLELGKTVEAERLYQRAIAQYGEIYGSDSPELTRPLQNLASLYLEHGQHGKAERSLRRLLALRPDASGQNPVDSIRTLQLQALTMQDMHRYGDAERLYRQALSVGEDPTGNQIQRATASVLNNLARLYIEIGRPREAVAPLQRALRIFEKRSRDNHPDLVKPMANLALVYATFAQASGGRALDYAGVGHRGS
jgi:tetratricopeptide (TPR) repeat protein